MTDTNIEKLKQFMYPIVGAIYEVHKELGPGLNEYVYCLIISTAGSA